MHKVLNRSAGWLEHSAGVWKVNLGSPETHSGYNATRDSNIGHLVVDGIIKAGKKKTRIEDLKKVHGTSARTIQPKKPSTSLRMIIPRIYRKKHQGSTEGGRVGLRHQLRLTINQRPRYPRNR